MNDFLDEIKADVPSPGAAAVLIEAVERINYTSTVLRTLSAYLQGMGDSKGANILSRCAEEMAQHESETL